MKIDAKQRDQKDRNVKKKDRGCLDYVTWGKTHETKKINK